MNTVSKYSILTIAAVVASCLFFSRPAYAFPPVNRSVPIPNGYKMSFDATGNNLWLTAGFSDVKRVNLGSMTVTGTANLVSFANNVLVISSQAVWATHASSISIINTSTLTATNVTVAGAANLGQLAYDGTNVWVVDPTVGKVFKLNGANGTLIGSYGIAGNGIATPSSYMSIVASTPNVFVAYSKSGRNYISKLARIDGSFVANVELTQPVGPPDSLILTSKLVQDGSDLFILAKAPLSNTMDSFMYRVDKSSLSSTPVNLGFVSHPEMITVGQNNTILVIFDDRIAAYYSGNYSGFVDYPPGSTPYDTFIHPTQPTFYNLYSGTLSEYSFAAPNFDVQSPQITQSSANSVDFRWLVTQQGLTDMAGFPVVQYGLTSPSNASNGRWSHTPLVTLSSLSAATYQYIATVRSVIGTIVQHSGTFTVTPPPAINMTNVQVTNIGSNTATVSWRTPISTSSNYVTRGSVITSATNIFNGADYTHTALLSRLDSSLQYSVTLISQQSGYTAGTAPAWFTTKAPYTVTATPTGTQTFSQGALATFTITVNPAFDFLFTSSLDLATNPVLVNSAQTFSPPILTSSQRSSTLTFTTTALTIGPTYNVPVTVTCNFCSSVFTATVTPSFVVSATPAVTITAGPTWTQLSSTSVRIDWTTLQAADSLVDYGVTQGYTLGPVINASLVGAPQQHQITLTGLFAGQTYHYRVKSRLAGFTDAVSIDQTFATRATTMTISNVQVTNIGAFSAKVSWQTLVSTELNYVVLEGVLAITAATNGTDHTALLSRLESSKPYMVTVKSSQSGYADAQASTSFTTLAPYTVSVAPAGTQNVTQGALATFDITVVPASDLSFATLPLATNPALANSIQTFSFPDIRPSQLSSTLTFTTDALTIGTTYNVHVTITCNSCIPVFTATVKASFTVGAPVPACELSLTPATQNIMTGIVGTLQLQLTSLNGFNQTVNIANISPVSNTFPNSKVSWTSFMGGGFPDVQTVRLNADTTVSQGMYRFRFQAKDPNPSSSVACDSPEVTVIVGPPDFTITAVPSSTQTVSKNQFANYEFQVRPIGVFTGSVQVSILQPNAGTAWPLGTYSPTAGAFGNAYGNMAVRVNTTTMAEGTYWAKVRAVSGSIMHEIDPVELIVGPPGMCDDRVTADQSCSVTQQWCDLSASPSLSENCVTNGIKCPLFQCAPPQTCNTTTGACVGDTTPPVISQPQCLTTMDSATITWTTDEPANSEVLWRKSTESLPYPGAISTDRMPPGATSHVVPIPQNGQLDPSTLYFVKVKSTDNQNNTAESAEIQCTTKATADTEAPVVQIKFPLSGATIVGSTAVRADASDNNGVVRVEFNTTNPNGTTGSINVDTTSPYEVNWDVAGLPSGTYALTAKATDAANNFGVSPQVRVNVNNDTLAPRISNFLPRLTAPNQYTVTWTTDELATSWVYYCLEPASGGACTYDKHEPANGTARSMSHRIVIDGLLPNRNYRLTPISCDAANNCNKPKPS